MSLKRCQIERELRFVACALVRSAERDECMAQQLVGNELTGRVRACNDIVTIVFAKFSNSRASALFARTLLLSALACNSE